MHRIRLLARGAEPESDWCYNMRLEERACSMYTAHTRVVYHALIPQKVVYRLRAEAHNTKEVSWERLHRLVCQ